MAINVRLKGIYTADFRKSEATLVVENPEVDIDDMGPRECVALVSGTGKLLSLVFPHLKNKTITSPAGHALKEAPRILPVYRYRIEGGGTFTPWMLQEYAEEMGLRFEDLKTFKEYFELDQQHRREEALARKREQEKEEARDHAQTAARVRQPRNATATPRAPRTRGPAPDGNPV
jgi:hypothetical protein